jgi:hypothetical protein
MCGQNSQTTGLGEGALVYGHTIFIKIFRFYRYECCAPYSVSFLLVLFIYAIDFFLSDRPLRWPSILSFLIIAAYYVLNLAKYWKNRLPSDDPKFFISLLTTKIVLWGGLLVALMRAR